MSLTEFLNRDKWDGVFSISECKRALNPSKLPGIDYALNPYGGCAHGCVYCYAPEVTHSEWKDWRAIRVRSNIAERLSKEIDGLTGVIGIGTTTDPYQYAEARFLITQQCLDIISSTDMSVHIHTKSDLILRDADLIGSIDHTIGVTVTNISESVSKRTEPGAPLPSVRLETIRKLVDSGHNVYVLVGPVMSSLEGFEEDFVSELVKTGVKSAVIDRLNGRPLLSERLNRMNITSSHSSEMKMKMLLKDVGIDVSDAF